MCADFDCDGACCLSMGDCIDTGQVGCQNAGGLFMGFEPTCADVLCLGACCLPEDNCVETGQLHCQSIDGSFDGGGTVCATDCPSPLGTAFTYQGRLNHEGQPLDGTADLIFILFNQPIGGASFGQNEFLDLPVVHGLITVDLDFGPAAFDGSARWLEIYVRSPSGAGAYTLLNPRQQVHAAPYALQTRGIVVDADQRVGLGTKTPLDKLHVAGPSPAIRLQSDDDPLSFTMIHDAQPSQSRMYKYTNSGISLMDLGPIPLDQASGAHVRLFRETNTTGAKSVQIYRGNHTSQLSAAIGADGEDSFFQLHGGRLGIGTASPERGLHTVGDGVLVERSGGDAEVILRNTSDGQINAAIQLRAIGANDGIVRITDQNLNTAMILKNQRVGLGVNEPALGNRLHVRAGAAPTATAIYAVQPGLTTGTLYAVYGHATTEGGSSFGNYGVYGRSDGQAGRGVVGFASDPDSPFFSTYGVYGESAKRGDGGTGVAGLASGTGSGLTIGVRGESRSTNGQGVFGLASAEEGITFGVRGEAVSPTGRGVSGVAWGLSECGIGVRGASQCTDGYDFFAGGAGVNYGSSSSIRWKRNIRPIEGALDKVAQLRGLYFDWNPDHGGHHGIGMVAEEVGKVLPEIVNYEQNGMDATGMDYSRLTPLLVEAVKHLRAEKDAEIAALRQEVQELKAMVRQLAAEKGE